MENIEDKYVKKLDKQKTPPDPEIRDQGKAAERVVIELIQQIIPGLVVREATSQEDSGRAQITKDPAIDAVGYLSGHPAIGIQITTAIDSKVRSNKTGDLINRPFMRLPEMTTNDMSIPRSLVFVEAAEVKAFLSDPDITKHPKLARQITESNIASLKIDLMKTKNPKEQELINNLLALFTEAKLILEKK